MPHLTWSHRSKAVLSSPSLLLTRYTELAHSQPISMQWNVSFSRLTEWFTPQMNTLTTGSLARNTFTFCWTKCFFLVFILGARTTIGLDVAAPELPRAAMAAVLSSPAERALVLGERGGGDAPPSSWRWWLGLTAPSRPADCGVTAKVHRPLQPSLLLRGFSFKVTGGRSDITTTELFSFNLRDSFTVCRVIFR